MVVYKATNIETGQAYIGQTTRSVEERWEEHCKPALKGKSYLSNAIQKYGKNSFKIEELCKASTQEELNLLEALMIAKHITMYPNGYNLKGAGSQGTISNRVREKISKSSTGKIISPETKLKISKTIKRFMESKRPYDETHKICSKCGRRKTRAEFNKNKANPSGLQALCTMCRRKLRSN